MSVLSCLCQRKSLSLALFFHNVNSRHFLLDFTDKGEWNQQVTWPGVTPSF